MSAKPLHDWANMLDRVIISGVDEEQKPLLKQFLLDYVELTGEHINPSCPSCLNSYISNYKKIKNMNTDNKCDYTLQLEYNGISLGSNTGIAVTNDNITNEYGEILTERFEALGTDRSVIFSRFPSQNEKNYKKPEPTITTPVKAPKLAEVLTAKKEEILSDEELAKSLLLEVVEPVIESGKDEVEDLENE